MSFRLYVVFALVIVVVRVGFRVLLGGGVGTHVLLDLPTIPLPDWVAGLQLLGPVTRESLLAALYDGLRLGTIVICVGAANSLANPKRLLKSMPPALYEIGTSVVVAVALLPQLADSLRRVRAARQLRGLPGGRFRRLRGIVVPVMEDALERSIALAAGMDARGYGRTGNLTRGRRATTGTLMLTGLVGICVGVYAVLDQTAPRWVLAVGLLLGLVLAGSGFWSAGRNVQRTRYRPESWALEDVLVATSGLATAALTLGWLRADPTLLNPAVDAAPSLTPAALLVAMTGLVAAVVAPPPQAAPPVEEEVTHARAA
jgi:energy-coupling factor transport system permease protein